LIDNLKKIKITAASGENHFVMDRGCFTYDQETTNPEVLSFIGTNDTTSGFESRYEAGDEKFVIKAEHRNGMIRIELIAPENCRYNRFNIDYWSARQRKDNFAAGSYSVKVQC